MHFFRPPLQQTPQYEAFIAAYRCDETRQVRRLLTMAEQPDDAVARIAKHAAELVGIVRNKRREGNGIDALMHEYQLSTPEGVVLMCLAEALLRIPDADTMDRLIHDKLTPENWERHLGKSESLFVNASTFGLMMSGRLLRADDVLSGNGHTILASLLQRSSEPVIRNMLRHAMRILGKQFVMGQTIGAALERAREPEAAGIRHSFDMLGEAARTAEDSERYLQAYLDAIAAIGSAAGAAGPVTGPGISIKLSALHPRYEYLQAGRVNAELYPRLLQLAQAASQTNIGLTIDAEEADGLELSLMLFERLAHEPGLQHWQGLGLAVQAYQKRAYDLIVWLDELAGNSKRRLMVRLVKGAYWDTEIKRAQERGLDNYPVFTRKASTDVSYIACARLLLEKPERFYPQFATHNAHTVATILELATQQTVTAGGFEFQRLHGMGAPLYEHLVATTTVPCRVYAPVGSYDALLPYLVRRLLENGANNSFVNRIADDQAPLDDIIADPRLRLASCAQIPHPKLELPRNLYPGRLNSRGPDLSDSTVLLALQRGIANAEQSRWHAAPLLANSSSHETTLRVTNPADIGHTIGTVIEAGEQQLEAALNAADDAFNRWNATPVAQRAACLERMAVLLEREQDALIALGMREAGKTLADCVAEVREATDFCRYYAFCARQQFQPQKLSGPTGEHNSLVLEGRGIFACISPWNFPLAIFTGQVAAALVAGNTVIAKPAEQTPLMAAAASTLLHEAGIPRDVLQLLPGRGDVLGAALVSDSRISGVAFTGGTETARAIARSLAARNAPVATFIAETGGVNAMVADSSALLEQVISDVLSSAFQSAGQRCSALRLLLVQEDIAEPLITMLKGAVAELRVGDPADLATDVGPLIDKDALRKLQAHAQRMDQESCLICKAPESAVSNGFYFSPRAYELTALCQLQHEVFGPVLHVLRYQTSQLPTLLTELNGKGYGLTFGIQSRIDSTVELVTRTVRAGNIYVNRNIIGAVPGAHPFGGMGLSGTGPKAGGPDYVKRFTVEKTISINTAAAGGNAALMTLEDE